MTTAFDSMTKFEVEKYLMKRAMKMKMTRLR
jgi:hypothetical protein